MTLKRAKHFINTILWALVCLYGIVVAVVNIPMVQSLFGRFLAEAITSKLGTPASVGRVDVGLFNRVIVDDICLLDQKGEAFFKATRLSVKIGCLEALSGNIAITSAQVFGMKARLYRATADAPLNIQYVIDSLSSKDTTAHKPLNLQVNSLVIRHGAFRYDELDAPKKASLDLRHLDVSNLSSHIMLNALRDDSLNVRVKKIALDESSGLHLKSLSFKFVAGSRKAILDHFDLQLPHSRFTSKHLVATYRRKRCRISPTTLHYQGVVNTSYVNLADLSFIDNSLKRYSCPLVFSVSFSGTSKQLRVHRLDAILARDAHARLHTPTPVASLSISGEVSSWHSTPRWSAAIRKLTVGRDLLDVLSLKLPSVVRHLGDASYRGMLGGRGSDLIARGTLQVEAGKAQLSLSKRGPVVKGHLNTDGLDLGALLDDNRLGILAAKLTVNGNLRQQLYAAQGNVSRVDWNQYHYQDVDFEATYDHGTTRGKISIDDPNVVATAQGFFSNQGANSLGNFDINVSRVNPTALGVSDPLHAGSVYGGRAQAAFRGNSLATLSGKLDVNDFHVSKPDYEYHLAHLSLESGHNVSGRYLKFDSDFGNGEVSGDFDYATLRQNIENLIVGQLPSLQKFTSLRHRTVRHDRFTMEASITRGDWLRHLVGLPIEMNEPVTLSASLNSRSGHVNIHLKAPDVVYNGRHMHQVSVSLTSPNDNLCADVQATQVGDGGRRSDIRVLASAQRDELSADLSLDNHAQRHRFRGHLLSTIQFDRDRQGVTEARFYVRPSQLSIGDTVFAVHPASVVYRKNHLQIDDLIVSNGNQHLKVSGQASKGSDDSITVDLKNVNVEYVLDLVGFHSVDFSGFASGKAYVTRLFDEPGGHADLFVNKFQFEEGNMGTLLAKVGWNPKDEQIDIDAQAVDTMSRNLLASRRLTTIRGYVSPKRNYIDLAIQARDTRGEFVQSLCSSFMRQADLSINGDLRLWGDLKQINLTGDAIASGKVCIRPLNTTYELRDVPIQFLVDEIRFPGDRVYDRNGNTGEVRGSVYHQHLSRLNYDIGVKLDHLLGYDWDGCDGSTFYGTVYASGDVRVRGRSGEVDIDIEATPEQGSQVVYNASTPDAITSREFIHWSSRDTIQNAMKDALIEQLVDDEDAYDLPSDIRINFLINTSPTATLKVIMDNTSGDYIALNGSGVIRASYYNKGGLDVYGNYLIDHGIYKLTIQNIIKRDFQFLPGGMITFGGDPMQAELHLKSQYQVNSVSLSDLQLGRSFSNNIRVNCLMDITGTPAAPRVDFNLDMPTVGSDAKQMIYSIINSEEEMNQQVLYLLAVGRFLAPGSNNSVETNTGEKQTSLAMQSILSGQLSQQINNVLSNVINNTNWNFGANISTGDEGWNNAEYEGLLSGRMLNNRLLINGQFGYRDNANATTSFIGDFDIRYLISPNGNFSVRVYNQANDRYFTRNSLNTQGISFVLKRDFNGWRDFFGLKSKATQPTKQRKVVKKP